MNFNGNGEIEKGKTIKDAEVKKQCDVVVFLHGRLRPNRTNKLIKKSNKQVLHLCVIN